MTRRMSALPKVMILIVTLAVLIEAQDCNCKNCECKSRWQCHGDIINEYCPGSYIYVCCKDAPTRSILQDKLFKEIKVIQVP
ncbi:unnamed protein product [Tenebrio molitor]|nr:unnamed protein product [Tenebrio molitor]